MNVKVIVPLAVAVVLGLVAAILSKHMLDGAGRVEKEGASDVSLLEVLVAARSIGPGERLDAEMLRTVRVERGGASGALLPAEMLPQIVGRVAKVQISAGSTVVERMLAPEGSAAGLPGVIDKGMRAITIQVDPNMGMTQFVEPGHYVDLIGRVPDRHGQGQLTKTLVQNILVLGVGARLSDSSEEEVVADGAQPQGPPTSITLLVTPEQAEKIDLATTQGGTRVALRSSNDRAEADTTGADFDSLLGSGRTRGRDVELIDMSSTPEPRTERVIRTRSIMIIRAGVEQEQTIEDSKQRSVDPSTLTGSGIFEPLP